MFVSKVQQVSSIKEKKYLEQLFKCGQIAEKQANVLYSEKLPKIEQLLNQSKSNLNEFVSISSTHYDFQDEQLEKVLLELTQSITFQLNVGLQNMKESLNKKQQHLSRFTVTLFGRTKAGKSTIREALTCGDGSTIGKGLQRTTRDIKEYEWNYLRIIDTPGIAAYEGEEDVAVAESIIDESDVILFLVTTDGIQESEFQKLAELKSLNKPIVILLNVKQDITNPLRKKRFLENCKEMVCKEGQIGHYNRIEAYTREYFSANKVNIIPFHAQAAFLSSQEQDSDMKKMLYEASRIEDIKVALQEIVIKEGTEHRIKTFHDAHIYFLNSLSSVYWDYYRKIKPRVKYLRNKFMKFNNWLNRFNEQGIKVIDNGVKEMFAPIYADIGNFVDSYAGKKGADAEWEKKVANYNLQRIADEICHNLQEEMQNYLLEFSRQLNFEVQSINFEHQSFGINDATKGVMGRVARWGGTALGVVEGALLIGTLTNFWNPAGWISGTLLVAAIAVNIFGWIFGDDTKRHEKEKDKIKRKMTSEIQKKENEIQKLLKTWFQSDIINPARKTFSTQVNKSIKTMEQLLKELEQESQSIDKELMVENRELLAELYQQSFGEDISYALSSISREQGAITKILYKDQDFLFITKRRKHLESVLGERIITVKFVSDPIELFKKAMFPAKLESEQIQYEYKNNKFIVKAYKDEIGKIIGKKGRHIKTASKLLNCIIEVQEG